MPYDNVQEETTKRSDQDGKIYSISIKIWILTFAKPDIAEKLGDETIRKMRDFFFFLH